MHQLSSNSTVQFLLGQAVALVEVAPTEKTSVLATKKICYFGKKSRIKTKLAIFGMLLYLRKNAAQHTQRKWKIWR